MTRHDFYTQLKCEHVQTLQLGVKRSIKSGDVNEFTVIFIVSQLAVNLVIIQSVATDWIQLTGCTTLLLVVLLLLALMIL